MGSEIPARYRSGYDTDFELTATYDYQLGATGVAARGCELSQMDFMAARSPEPLRSLLLAGTRK